jgi:intracellular septation protein
MSTLIELAPLIVFFLAYKFAGGIYPATVVLMAGMALLLAYDWLRTRSVPKMHLISAILVWLLGAATLILQDLRFLQWKSTVFAWLVALVFIGSTVFGKSTVLEQLLSKGLPDDARVEPRTWRNATLATAAFFILMGGVNLWVAFTMSEEAWVTFKSWIFVPAMFVFTLIVSFWLLRGYDPPDEPSDKRDEAPRP